ncbi:Ferredoxin-dependent glutamate synthase [Thioalkalivibrio nitratireducens DSM 14787]|uniref:Ferredoxin-dependent glutamate synthase n=1 Tax=Thioalkalivibrio nitratireducens (strain DSM 14787 / UNIQEM 213 / ALEN2) TaxID=1255043 RepID=L0DSU7_THIND|nr:FMN-binding glutamate synthase family protein [Thioalkalivibrio nitratireducens]AGA32689.1 Ferredoxin-dependent glutamate synthase [Thioalkalivibrio nitratireducens DSM 14787]
MYIGFLVFAGTSLLLLAVGWWFWPPVAWAAVLIVPLLALGTYDVLQTRHSIRRNFPLLGRARWLMETLRPFMRQYFVESDTDGVPINRMFRSIVYQRAKGELETVPFGTRVDVYRHGYEWIGHSVAAIRASDVLDLRVDVGGPDCRQPYRASIFNISALSFGALSPNAILALNHGAALGGFAQNTGEGGLAPCLLEHGGDLVWQIGTGYFGCRDARGRFSGELFEEKAAWPAVRMIEIKLSQGAKPGHGGILPAEKNTPEIAAIRGVEPGTVVESPPAHSVFDSLLGLLEFVARLRELSGGKPVGFKLAVGRKSEFVAICKAMVASGIVPDFITVDGGEGGTGAAPLEYANSVGMPLREALAFVDDCLTGFDLRSSIRVIASGKILTGFHLVKNLAVGADLCSSARGMMFALGCVHSLICNTNRCPSGVATQDPRLYRGLVVADKAQRVAQFQAKTVHATAELIASAGLFHTSELNRTHIYRRVTQSEIRRYDRIYPYLTAGVLRDPAKAPEAFAVHLEEADPERFMPRHCLTRSEDPRGDPHLPCTMRQYDRVSHL